MIGVNGKLALGSVTGCLLGALLTAPALAGRLQPQGPKRVILNDDGHGGFYGGQLNSAEALRNLPQRFRDTHLWIYQWGVMLGTKVNYPSQVAELCGEGASPEVLRQVRSGDRNLLALLTRLRQEKVDTLQCVAEGCHRAGLLCYVTIRANPCYPLKYPGWPDESLARFYNAKFWWDHPEFRIRTKSGQVQVSLSYAYPEVRAVKLAIVHEVLQRDVDGIDIDFLRHPPVLGYEEPLVKAYQAEYGVDPRKLADDDPRWLDFRCRTVTGLMREVRRLADDAGRQKHRYLGVSVRVDHRQYRQWGLDVKTWMKEGLIDILTVAQHGLGGYDLDLSPFVTMARGTGCLVFAGEEAVVAGEDPTPKDEEQRKSGKPVPTRSATLTLEEYRNRARKWYSQGAAGVHTFNESRPEVFKFLGDPAKPPARADANFIATAIDLKARIPSQLHITRPDYLVFVPEVAHDKVSDTGNEHFLVFDGPDGSLMAVWTQSSAEAQPDQHIAFSRSTDEGVTWARPRIIAGPKRAGAGPIASWAYPLVSKSGRIYVLYSQHIGKYDAFYHSTGWLHGIASDDCGQTWSPPENVPVARSINDNPDPSFPPNMLCWQKPLRLGQGGKYFAGFTRWTSSAVRANPTGSWISHDSRVEFMRFENVDENPRVADLKIRWFASNEKALSVPFPGHPEVSACQEPSIVKLPDGRLFVVMRTASGSPFWSTSADGGETWAAPRRLLRRDGGEPLLHPLSPCPIYDVGGNTAGSGRYVLFIHNHDGHCKGFGPTDTSHHRRPIYLVRGRFRPGAEQPVWFDEPRWFMDHDGVSLGKPGTPGRTDLALYASFTVRDGRAVLWYPDRKFFLLGRVIAK